MLSKKSKIRMDKMLILDMLKQIADGGTFYKHHGFVPLTDAMAQQYIKVLKKDFGFSADSISFLTK